MSSKYITSTSKSAPIVWPDGFNKLVIGIPLLVSLLFSVSYFRVEQMSQQRLVAADRAHHQTTSDTKLPLNLITQPALPTLNQTPDTITTDAHADSLSTETTVGPSSTSAGSALQNAPQNNRKDGNELLQATRKTLKLDELSL